MIDETNNYDDSEDIFIRLTEDWKFKQIQLNPQNTRNIEIATQRIILCYRIENQVLMENLDLSNLSLLSLPDHFSLLIFVKNLDLSNNNLFVLPQNFHRLNSLERLNLSHNSFLSFPEIRRATSLENIQLDHNFISQVPDYVRNLPRLAKISLSNNRFTDFPNPSILINLSSLNLSGNQIQNLPDNLSVMQNMRFIDLSLNRSIIYPTDALSKLLTIDSLEEINFSSNNLSSFPGDPFLYRLNLFINLDRNPLLLTEEQFQGIQDGILNLSVEDQNFYHDFFDPESLRLRESRPNLPLSSIQEMINASNFSDEERAQNIREIFSNISPTHNNIDVSLSERLGAIIEFLDGSSPNNVILTLAIDKFIKESRFWISSNPQKKQQFSRQFLSVLSKIYERKDEQIFIEQLNILTQDSISGCSDRNNLLIFMLFNYCQRSNLFELEPLSQTQPLQLFNYIKNQLLFNYFLQLGKELSDTISATYPSFKEEIEVLLNFLRIYNNETGELLDLNIPKISYQNFYIDHLDMKPSQIEIDNFKIIALEFSEGRPQKFCDLLASQILKSIDDNSMFTNPEILELSFVNNIKKQIDDIAGSFLELLNNHKDMVKDPSTEINSQKHLENINFLLELKKQIFENEFKDTISNYLQIMHLNQISPIGFNQDEILQIEEKFLQLFREKLKIKVVLNERKEVDDYSEISIPKYRIDLGLSSIKTRALSAKEGQESPSKKPRTGI